MYFLNLSCFAWYTIIALDSTLWRLAEFKLIIIYLRKTYFFN